MPRTVLFLHGSTGGYGADRQLYNLASGLDRRRYQPLVVVPDRGPLTALLQGAGVGVHVTPLAVLRRRYVSGRGAVAAVAQLARNRHELGRLARESKVSIVHTNTSTILPGEPVARAIGAPHLVHVREIYDGAGGKLAQRAWPLYRRRLLHADALACVSAAAAAQFGSSDRAFVVHDAVPAPMRCSPRDAAREALDLPPTRFIAVVVGRVSDWKGQNVFARALAQAPLARIGAIGLVAGDAAPGQKDHEAALAKLRDELGLGERLRLLGFREDIETVYAAADAVVVPSVRPDAFPNCALEAAASGVPVVATQTGGLPEIVRDRVTGRLVPPGDPVALADALTLLAQDPDAARRLGVAAAADVNKRFSVERMLNSVQTCYDSLVD